MRDHRVAVIGAAGEMASVGVERFAAHAGDSTFELFDLDVGRVEQLAGRLPRGRATVGALDLFDGDALRRAIEGASLVVLGAGPYRRTAPPVMRACITAGVDYIDLDDDIESTREALALDAKARSAGTALFVGCGASPGMSNVMAVDAATQLDRVESIDVCWVTGDEGPRRYGSAVIEHILHIGAGEALSWRDGRQVTVETFVENELVDFGGAIGHHRVYETAHPEAVTLPRRFRSVRSVRVLGGAHPQPVNGIIKGLSLAVARGRITVPEAIEWFQAVLQDETGSLKGWRHALGGMVGQVRRRESSLADLGGYLWQGLRKQHQPYRGALLVRATGTRGGEPAAIVVRTPTGGPDTYIGSSMAAITGTCLAAFATLALDHGGERKGVLMPEDWIDPPDFYAALERVGVPPSEIIDGRLVSPRVGVAI